MRILKIGNLAMYKICSLLIVLLTISGCATVKYQSVPPMSAQNTGNSIHHSEMLDQTTHTLMHINEKKDILYLQNFGGGGAAVGLLLGPLGVAANVAAIESNTKSDVEQLFGKVAFEPKELLMHAAHSEGFVFNENTSQGAKFSPYIYISKTENEKLYISSAMIVEYQNGQDSWIGKYFHQADLMIAKDDVANGIDESEHELLRKAFEKGFKNIIALYKNEKSTIVEEEKEIVFRSDFVMPRFDYDLLGKLVASSDERVTIRTNGAVYSLPKRFVTVKPKA